MSSGSGLSERYIRIVSRVFVSEQWSAFADPPIPFDLTRVPTTDGAMLHIRSYGPHDAPVVVFAHGFACRIEYWNPQIAALAESHRVVAYDQRGLGRSTMGSRRVSAQVLGDDLDAVLGAVLRNGVRAALVGHSFGGITVMSLAKWHPERLQSSASSILLADTVSERFAASTAMLPFPGRYRYLRQPLMSRVAQLQVPLPAERLSRRPFRRLAMSRHADPLAVDFGLAVMSSCRPHMRAVWGAGLAGIDVTGGLFNINVPTTVVVGEIDKLTPPPTSHFIAAILRDRGVLHRLVELPGVGHCSNLEAPERFNDELDQLMMAARRKNAD